MKSFTLNLVSAQMRSLVCAAVFTVAGLGMVGGSVQAGDCTPTYRYEWKLYYETRQVPYTANETRYDHCGKAYYVNVTRYRAEQVSVWRYVRVPSDMPPANLPNASTPPSNAPNAPPANTFPTHGFPPTSAPPANTFPTPGFPPAR